MVDKSEKSNLTWLTLIQILFLFYYLSYSNSLISSNLILMVACLILIFKLAKHVIRNKMNVSIQFFLACIGSLWAFICSFINGSGLGSATTQSFLLLSLCLFSNMNLSHYQHKIIMKRMAIILIVILAIFSKSSPYRSFYMSRLSYMSDSVSINPNCIAMLTFFLFVYLFVVIEETDWKNKYKKLMQVIIFLFSVGYIYITSARTAIVSCCIYIILYVFCKYKRYKLIRVIFLIGLCFSLGIVFIYIAMYSSGFLLDKTIGGKGFYTGRETIWLEALILIKNNLIFGFSNQTTFTYKKLLSTHNSLLAMLSYFGIFGLLIAMYTLFKSFKKIEYKSNVLTVSAIFAALFFMSFETMITDWSLLLPYCFLFLQRKG